MVQIIYEKHQTLKIVEKYCVTFMIIIPIIESFEMAKPTEMRHFFVIGTICQSYLYATLHRQQITPAYRHQGRRE